MMKTLANQSKTLLTSLGTLILLGLLPVSLANAQAPSLPLTVSDTQEVSPYRQSNVNKAWIVGDPAMPEQTLIQRLDMGTIVKVTRTGTSWDKVEVLDGQRASGWVLKQLFDPAMSGLVQQALDMQRLSEQQSQLIQRGAQLAHVLNEGMDTGVPTPQANPMNPPPTEAKLAETRAAWHRAMDRVRDAQGAPARTASAPTAPVAPVAAVAPAVTVRPRVEIPVTPAPVAAPARQPETTPAARPEPQPAPQRYRPTPHPQPAQPDAQRQPTTPVANAEAPMASPDRPVLPAPGSGDAPIRYKDSPSPTAEAKPSRHPSVPEDPSGPSTTGIALASSPPPAIIPADAGQGASGVTLTGTIILLMVLAGIGGVSGWWRRRQPRDPESKAMKLSSLATVPVGKDATVALIGAPGRTLLVGCSPAGVHLVSSDLDDSSLLSNGLPGGESAQRSFRELFAGTLGSVDANLKPTGPAIRPRARVHSAPDAPLPASREIQRLAAARSRILGVG